MNELLASIAELGIELVPDGLKLKVRIPDYYPPEVAREVHKHRKDLVEAYNSRAAIREYDGGFDREEAEKLAIQDLLEIGERWRAPAH